MTMRKHKITRNFAPSELWVSPSAQNLRTLSAYGKLLGILSPLEEMIKRANKASARWLARFNRLGREKTAEDHARIARAAATRAVKQTKRAKAYAKCIAGNWNKTLTELPHYQGVRVAKNLVVDKFFVKMHA